MLFEISMVESVDTFIKLVIKIVGDIFLMWNLVEYFSMVNSQFGVILTDSRA